MFLRHLWLLEISSQCSPALLYATLSYRFNCYRTLNDIAHKAAVLRGKQASEEKG
jgi:hypothetical protein